MWRCVRSYFCRTHREIRAVCISYQRKSEQAAFPLPRVPAYPEYQRAPVVYPSFISFTIDMCNYCLAARCTCKDQFIQLFSTALNLTAWYRIGDFADYTFVKTGHMSISATYT